MIRSLEISNGFVRRRAFVITLTLCVGFFCFLFSASEAFAQRRFSRTYPAGQNVHVQLLNRTGTITVEGWNRPSTEPYEVHRFVQQPERGVPGLAIVPLHRPWSWVRAIRDRRG